MLRLLTIATAAIATFTILNSLLSGQGMVQAQQDWANCTACHENPGEHLPPMHYFRVSGLGAGLPARCSDCHEQQEMLPAAGDWRHPVRPLAVHLNCTDCHPAVAHDADSPPPMPTGDYSSESCFECHSDIKLDFAGYSKHRMPASARCIDCHPAHEPTQIAIAPYLLDSELRQYFLAGYDWQASNQGCLECHSMASLAFDTQRGFATYNTENYHVRHVMQSHALCIDCHTPHGSMRDHLIRAVQLDGALLSYFPEAAGANCTLTCHSASHEGWSYTNEIY